jgi:hypothetical protein
MTPQLSVQQLEHAIKNLQRRVDAKKLECHSLDNLRQHAPISILAVLAKELKGEGSTTDATLNGLEKTRESAENLLTAKLNQALIDLDELELQLKAVKQMSSGILIPGMQITQKQR